ncbi:geranylgeranyl pyrophosphate synthase [Actinoplanes sp. NBRC 14428]|uniref:Geranylgeranyl diphosphate synthase type I n=1 Tax=Pseudosporangium ferrugineum TaxID=439699 RepID=A0A2T0SJF6_9ACTN|nr:polyprenyl synthetase family protein [Pseudosporangium ferrugineum]PRY33549.1 geranylgeranyl diphosphate synthase type I [Pseudosporangium ferrugineum]BCJ56501.1 geranylgeranyl pyrophosphate synthase [Actinoplanes sp. NBRC 14428]
MSSPPSTMIDLDEARQQVTEYLLTFLAGKRERARKGALPSEIPATLESFVAAGGKRLRPLLCLAGWQAAGGDGLPEPVLRTAAALELYQAFALIHDDIIDNTDTRRSRPTVHREIAARLGHHDRAAQVGASAALLIGNMALTWSDELYTTAGVPAGRRGAAASVIDVMREEMHYGQYLDLMTALGPITDQRAAMAVIRYKTAKYTVERPLHVGAALAGADAGLLETLSRFALPLGDAFQLRDDLLGIFGDPLLTGKPVSDDLREGKRTVLLAIAARRATATQRDLLESLVGRAGLTEPEARAAREVIAATGAPEIVEAMIAERYRESLTALDDAPRLRARATLRKLAMLCVERDS